MNILLVDDEPQILKLLEMFLRNCGHNVLIAADGAQAVQVLEEQGDVDVILSDLRMPKMDGLQLLEVVVERWQSVPFLLLTGPGDEEVASSAVQRGARDCMKKPLGLADLRRRLAELETEIGPG